MFATNWTRAFAPAAPSAPGKGRAASEDTGSDHQRSMTGTDDLNLDRPADAFEALRRVVSSDPISVRTPPHRRHLMQSVESALATYVGL